MGDGQPREIKRSVGRASLRRIDDINQIPVIDGIRWLRTDLGRKMLGKAYVQEWAYEG